MTPPSLTPTVQCLDNEPVRLKKSRYLHQLVLSDADVLLLFGGLGGRLVEVPGPFIDIAQQMLKNPEEADESVAPKLFRLIREQGLLVPGRLDEQSALESAYTVARRSKPHQLGVTICPTLACNFRCTYCYQHHPSGAMSGPIQEKILHFIEGQTRSKRALNVTWFGGEPLLCLHTIELLSRSFMDLHGGQLDYHATMVTNGSLLTKETSQLLADLNIKRIQVTLDGPSKIHDQRRPMMAGGPTFDIISRNLADADPRLKITVRVNIDRNNARHIPLMFEQLDKFGLRGRVNLSFSAVRAYTNVCADLEPFCLPRKHWSRLHCQLQLQALNHGYGYLGLPRVKINHCMADQKDAWLISPEGLLLKCWNDATQPEKAVLDLSVEQKTPEMLKMQNLWRHWNPFSFQECRDCDILPFCMGGCPYTGLRRMRPATIESQCSEIRDNLKERIAIYYLAYKRKESTRKLLKMFQ